MDAYLNMDDPHLLTRMGEGDASAFEAIYARYSTLLYKYACSRIRNSEDAEEIIHDLFMWLWEKRESASGIQALKPYLYSAVRNRIAERIAHSVVREKYEAHYIYFTKLEVNSTEESFQVEELRTTINKSLESLPPNCQHAFRLSRFEHLSISDIADKMQLSTGTVENYITSALKHLREVLGDVHRA